MRLTLLAELLKLSPLLDTLTWRDVPELYSCSDPPVRHICVLDRVYSIRIEDHIDYVTPDAFIQDVRQC